MFDFIRASFQDLKQKFFIHIRDEELTPRYHPNSVERFEGCKLQVLTFNIHPFNFQTLFGCYNGLTRE
jgi:hypothetical protein